MARKKATISTPPADLRTDLTLFRVALGLTCLLDVCLRASERHVWLTDDGVLPRDARDAFLRGTWYSSLHTLSGDAALQTALLAAAAAAALALALGWCTRLASVAAWLLCCSLHSRNPLTLHGGDVLLRLLLFWSMFVPLGPGPARTSLGLHCLRGQVALMYACAALSKSGAEWWGECSAVHLALQLDLIATPAGIALRDAPPALLCAATRTTLVIELLAAPLLLYSRTRVVALAVLLPLHASFGIFLRLGTFPLVSAVALLPFLPPRRAEAAAESRSALPAAAGVAVMVAIVLPLTCARHAPFVRAWWRGGGAAPATLRGYGAWEGPAEIEGMAQLLMVDQVWDMFSPHPVRQDAWLLAPAERIDGSVVDALTGEAPEWRMPERLTRRFATTAWLQYTMNLVSDASTAAPHWELFEALCAALCRGVLAPPAAPAIASIELWVMRQASPATAAECAAAPTTPEASLLFEWSCGSAE